MINVCKELSDVAFQNPACAGVIFRNFAGESQETIKGFMRAFPFSARIRIMNEFLVEVRIQHAVDAVVEQPVSNGCFVDIARLGVVYLEGLIFAMLVYFIFQISMQGKYVVHQAEGELHDIFPFSFPAQEFLPRHEQVLDGYDTIETMNSTPPPEAIFAAYTPPLSSRS